jgi:hypothetical protein
LRWSCESYLSLPDASEEGDAMISGDTTHAVVEILQFELGLDKAIHIARRMSCVPGNKSFRDSMKAVVDKLEDRLEKAQKRSKLDL